MIGTTSQIRAFVAESNRIEGIHHLPTDRELSAHEELWAREYPRVSDLERFVDLVAGAPLRDKPGMNVRVGPHVPPPGGPLIRAGLQDLLERLDVLTAYEAHHEYESLHPFMDGNGRSGRALWAWHMRYEGNDPFALDFLHRWYYQSLDAGRP